MTDPLNLTFGIEIECIVCFDPSDIERGLHHCEGVLWDKDLSAQIPHNTKLRTVYRQTIADILKHADIRTYDVIDARGDQAWTVAPDASITTVDGLREDGFMECDVEIKSPAFRFCPRALRRIEKVVRVLRKLNAFVNESCGFHVHIGNRKSSFPLQTLKHFCMLTALFEHQLNSLHPPHRVGNEHAKPPSAVFQGQNLWDCAETIQSCKATRDLVLLYAKSERRPDRRFAYNLVPLISGPHKTIEFRQHKGTLEWREMINWVQVAGGMVNAAHGTSADRMALFISICAFDPKSTIYDLLIRLKLKDLNRFYMGEMHLHLRPEPIWVLDEEDGTAEAGPRKWWEHMEKRHRVERVQELRRIDELDRLHELERQRVFERQNEEPDPAGGEAQEQEAGS